MKKLITFENFSLEDLEKLDLNEKDIENKSGEIQDIFIDLESEIDIKVKYNFVNNNRSLNHLYITLTSEDDLDPNPWHLANKKEISDQVHKIREIGKAISRLENCMQFYRGDAECVDKYGDILDFTFDLNFLDNYDENSTLDWSEEEEGDEPIGIIPRLTILFHYV